MFQCWWASGSSIRLTQDAKHTVTSPPVAFKFSNPIVQTFVEEDLREYLWIRCIMNWPEPTWIKYLRLWIDMNHIIENYELNLKSWTNVNHKLNFGIKIKLQFLIANSDMNQCETKWTDLNSTGVAPFNALRQAVLSWFQMVPYNAHDRIVGGSGSAAPRHGQRQRSAPGQSQDS